MEAQRKFDHAPSGIILNNAHLGVISGFKIMRTHTEGLWLIVRL